MKFNVYTYSLFYILYILSEILVQHNMEYSQWIRWHLSDIFAAPVITHLFLFIILLLISGDISLDNKILLFFPLINFGICIIYECFLQITDIIDIYCYIGGTALYYLTCINYKTLFK